MNFQKGDMGIICVLLSTFNGERWIGEQLDSILGQDGVCVHIIVRDDGSKDGTVSILKEYSASHRGAMTILEGSNVGYAQSFSVLVREALQLFPECNRFAFADQDDVWDKDKLLAADMMLSRSEPGKPMDTPAMYCSNVRCVDKDLKFLRNRWDDVPCIMDKARAIMRSRSTGCTMLFNKAAAKLYAKRCNFDVRVHDYFMFLSCVFFGIVVYDPSPHMCYRQHGNNSIGSPSKAARWRRRLSMNWDRTHATSTQARLFLASYKDILPLEDIEILSRVAFYRNTAFTRLSLALDRRFRRRGVEARLIDFLKIMGGGCNRFAPFTAIRRQFVSKEAVL